VANEPITGKEAVTAALPGNPAIQALNSAGSEFITDAKLDRNELTLTIPAQKIRQACEIVRSAGYNFFCDLTAVDWYPAEPRFQLSYHLLSHQLKHRIRLKALVTSDDPAVESITSLWPAANNYEREVWDLFGVRFQGHPDLRRIMMPEEWEGHPLQKTYPVEGYR
jgi:NADH-quinone oxidoreductase subunit C